VHGQVEALGVLVELGGVEWALAARRRDATAGGTPPGGTVDAVTEEEELDAAVRRSLERGAPAGGGPPALPRLVSPAANGISLALAAPALRTGVVTARSSAGPAWASAAVRPMTAARVSELMSSEKAAHVSSEQTTTTCDPCARRTVRSSSPAIVLRCSWTSASV
jgi:hypothetical protein